MLDSIDYQLEPEARCPYCGKHILDSWTLFEEDEVECECECGGTFKTRRVIDTSYSSTPIFSPSQAQERDK